MGEILTLSAVRKWRDSNPGALVVTNGCFDILHYGHVVCLKASRELGCKLLVGVNSDRAVRLLKGATRPVNAEFSRMFILSELRCVSAVCLVDDTCMADFIRAARPAIWAKGGDYALDTLNSLEVAAAREVQAEIHIVPLVPGYSTSDVLMNHRRAT